MKAKLFAIVLCLSIITLGLAGCSNKDDSDNSAGKQSSTINDNSITDSEDTDNNTNVNSGNFDYTIKILDVEYNFPMTYEEFVGYGWKMNDEELEEDYLSEATFDPEACGTISSSGGGLSFYNGDIKGANPFFYNPSKTENTVLKDCLIAGIALEPDVRDGIVVPAGSVVLSDKLTVGESTYDEVIALYGESEMGNAELLIYGEDYFNQGLYLNFDENKVFVGVQMVKNY